MPRYSYVNGAYERHGAAMVHIEDRGYQFADGVYEVCLAVDGALWDCAGHLARWRRSLSELSIDAPMNESAMLRVMANLLRRNRLRSALIYIQATRGVAPRNHAFPAADTPPAIVMTARPFSLKASDALAQRGVAVVTAPDIRWGRVDIKTISLLPNVLAKDAAKRAGAFEAILVKDGVVTEGSSSNFWIVTRDGVLKTHPKGHAILGGITRETVIACAQELQISVSETPFTINEALTAREAFLTSATGLVMPVTQIDGALLDHRDPGEMSLRLRADYISSCKRNARRLLQPLH